MFLPALGINDDGTADHVSVMLLDDFSGHKSEEVKEKTVPMNDVLKWEIMAGGITPLAHPLDVLINKVWKGYFRDLFECWSLTAPVHPVTGNPLAPSRQLLAQWAVMAWDKIPEALVRKAWEVCGYKSVQKLTEETEAGGAIVAYNRKEIGAMIEAIAGPDAAAHFLHDPENESEQFFPEDEDESDTSDEDSKF